MHLQHPQRPALVWDYCPILLLSPSWVHLHLPLPHSHDGAGHEKAPENRCSRHNCEILHPCRVFDVPATKARGENYLHVQQDKTFMYAFIQINMAIVSPLMLISLWDVPHPLLTFIRWSASALRTASCCFCSSSVRLSYVCLRRTRSATPRSTTELATSRFILWKNISLLWGVFLKKLCRKPRLT